MLHDFVGRDDLPSAVRLNATFRSLGVLCGPVVGSTLLLVLGPTGGIFVNIAIYLPLTIFLFRTRFTGHVREEVVARPRVGPIAALRAARGIGISPTVGSMIVLAGLGSFFVGASIQSAMPEFAESLGAGSTGITYGALLFAAGFGGVVGGLVGRGGAGRRRGRRAVELTLQPLDGGGLGPVRRDRHDAELPHHEQQQDDAGRDGQLPHDADGGPDESHVVGPQPPVTRSSSR